MIKSLAHLEEEIAKGQQFEKFNPFSGVWRPVLTKEIQQYDVNNMINNEHLRVKQKLT